MNTEPLIKAVVAAILLLENSGSEEIDPDTAAQGLEAIGHELLQLSNEDRSYFVNAIDEIASLEDSPAASQSIKSIPFKMGMLRGEVARSSVLPVPRIAEAVEEFCLGGTGARPECIDWAEGQVNGLLLGMEALRAQNSGLFWSLFKWHDSAGNPFAYAPRRRWHW